MHSNNRYKNIDQLKEKSKDILREFFLLSRPYRSNFFDKIGKYVDILFNNCNAFSNLFILLSNLMI